MKSMKLWVIAMEVMNIAKIIGVVIDSRIVEKLSVIIATKFMWIPGVRPVRVPARSPNKIAREISNIIIVKRIID